MTKANDPRPDPALDELQPLFIDLASKVFETITKTGGTLRISLDVESTRMHVRVERDGLDVGSNDDDEESEEEDFPVGTIVRDTVSLRRYRVLKQTGSVVSLQPITSGGRDRQGSRRIDRPRSQLKYEADG